MNPYEELLSFPHNIPKVSPKSLFHFLVFGDKDMQSNLSSSNIKPCIEDVTYMYALKSKGAAT